MSKGEPNIQGLVDDSTELVREIRRNLQSFQVTHFEFNESAWAKLEKIDDMLFDLLVKLEGT